MALDYDPFSDFEPPVRPPKAKSSRQLQELIYSHLLTAKADYEAAEDGNAASDRIKALNSALARRKALAPKGQYEATCRALLLEVFGQGYV